MAVQDAELKLKVSLDLGFFRQQLSGLGQAAAGYNVPINVKFDRRAIQNELNALGRNISQRTYRLEVATNISAEIKNAEKLARLLREMPAGSRGVAGTTGKGLGQRAFLGVDPAEIKKLYKAAGDAGLISFRESIANNKKEIAKELGSIGKDSVAGLLNGLSSQNPQLQKAAETLGKDLIASVKGVLGIASPSREFKKIGEDSGKGFEQGLIRAMEIAEKSATRQLQKMLDRLARMALMAGGMSAAEISRQAGAGIAQRMMPGPSWAATTPSRSSSIGPSSSGRLLTGAAAMRGLPGSAYGEQKRLIGDILSPSLKEILRGAANAFADAVRNELNSAVRSVQVRDLGRTVQAALSPQRTAGLLSAGVGRAPSVYSTGAIGGESRQEMIARRTREAYVRSSLREMDVMGGGAGRTPSPYSYAYRGARPLSAIVPYAAGGAIVPAGEGGGAPPVPPSGGGGGMEGMGGMGGFGRALGGINIPGTGVVREIGNEFAMATKQVLLFGTAYKALAFATSFPAQVGQAVGALQSFNNTLKAISPSAEEARTSNQFILDIVDRYNVPLQSARDGFTKLYASMAPAGFKGDEIRALFTGVSQAAATFGMSAEKVDRVNYAFAQMASKGQVMSEELKGQLGDVLPGAMGIFAEAAGFEGKDAIEKFSKALEDGAYKGDAMRVLLKNVTGVLQKEFGPGAEGAARTFQGVINRMQNSTKLLYEAFEPVAVGFLNGVVVPLTGGLKTITDGFNAFFRGTQAKTSGGFAIAQELEKLRPAFDGIRANLTQLVPTFQSFGQILLSVSKAFLQIAGNPFVGYIARVYLNVLALTTAIQLLNLRALIPMIANFARSAYALIAFTVQCARAGRSAQVMGLMIGTAGATLRAFFATTGVGLVLVGLGLLIEKFIGMNQALADTKAKALGAAEAIRSMSQTEARQASQQYESQAQSLKGLNKQIEEGKMKGKAWIEVTRQQADALKSAGVTVSNVRGSLQVQPMRIGGAYQQVERLASEARFRVRATQFEENQAATPATIAPIPEGAGKGSKSELDKLANQQQQNAIDAANRQNALNKAITEGLMALDDQAFQHRIDLIDARNNYELAGLNSIEARQEKFQQDLQKIELQRIDTVRKAQQSAAKAVMEYSAAQNTATAAGGGGAMFGATGRTFNAPGWVHGHFQNANREALVKDTVQVVMKLLEQGISPELSSGASFKKGMSQSQIEALVRQGIGSHKKYASGTSAIDVFVPKGTNVPVPLSGVSNLGGAAGVGGRLPLGSQLMHLDPRSASGGAMARREARAGGKLAVEAEQASSQQEQAKQAIIFATNKALEERAALIKANINSIFPVAEQRLENDLMKMRNQLQMQGMPQEYIDYQEKVYKGAYESAESIKRLKEETLEFTKEKNALQEKQKQGITLTDGENQSLKYYTDAIRQNDEAVDRLTEQQRAYNTALLESTIASMKNADALKAQQDAMNLIKGSVDSASSSYKGFLKEVAMGGDPTEALKKFQEAITDQVLTVFFDFAMKPVEDFFKEQLSAVFGIKTEEDVRKETIAKLEEQLKLQKNIDANVEKIASGGAAPPAGSGQTQSFSTAFNSGQGLTTAAGMTDAASVFSGGGNLAGGIFDTIAQQMDEASGSFDNFSSHMSKFVDSSIASAESLGSWNESMATSLSESLTKQTDEAEKQGGEWQKSLGTAVSAIGIAAGAIMGIASGISQIKEGGTANILGGIGSIFLSVGGAIGGFGKLFGANGGVADGGWKPFPVSAFASGGMVTGPTLGLVGEGKYNEAIVPLPDGRSIPVKLKGSNDSSLREAMSQPFGSNGIPVLNMSFQSTTINGVEYVSRDQLEQAMAQTRRQASREGAQRGMSMTLDKLQQSPSTRSRVGIR